MAQESEEGDSAGAANHHFVKQALQPLVAMLLEQLVKQEEGQVCISIDGQSSSCQCSHPVCQD